MSNYICKEEQVIIVLFQIFVLDLKILQTLLFFLCKNCTCCCSVIKSCLTVYDLMVCNIPGYLLAYSYLPEFASLCYLPYFSQIHIHWSMMISICLILCCPFLHLPSIFSNITVFTNKLVLCIRWPKFWSFTNSPSNEYSGLISFQIDWFGPLEVQGILKSHFQLLLLLSHFSLVWLCATP